VNFASTKSKVKGRGVPPESFLTELVNWAKTAPDELFAPNNEPGDVFNVLRPLLGPWKSPLHRRAAMCELLRCLAGFESSWDWNEGVDTTNARSMANIVGQETGIFQVSYDSLPLEKSGKTLSDCVKRYCGGVLAPQVFIDTMKRNHTFALEYCTRLLRFSYRWDGPIKRGEINSSLSRDAVREFEKLLA